MGAADDLPFLGSARRSARAGSTARFVDGDVRALPFDDSTVDLVCCELVFQHLDDPDRVAAEIARMLRPGGRVMVSDWSTMTRPGEAATVDAVRRFWLGRFPRPDPASASAVNSPPRDWWWTRRGRRTGPRTRAASKA
ncbi:MAG: methyltransferase domain-containing protein [Labedaea sp.]